MVKSFKKGFTLAEVLVTLVVIGIVAALSIPALLQNTNQAELKTAFKKSLSTLNQALVMSVAQNSTDAASCTGCAGAGTKAALANFFSAKLNVISQDTSAADPYFFTADGMQYTVTTKGGTCSNADTADYTTANCVITVDVNGTKSPNTASEGTGGTTIFRDRYFVVVRANSVIPGNATTDAAVQALQN